MISPVLIQGLLIFVALIFLLVGTFVQLFLERFVHARVQHREGPGRSGKVDYFQVWKDFRKVRNKIRSSKDQSLRHLVAGYTWRVLPAIFLIILFVGVPGENMKAMELPILLLLPMIGSSLEASFLHISFDSKERFEWRRKLLIKVAASSVLALSVLAVSIKAGGLSLSSFSLLQNSFPFHSILSSPGLFACGVAAFGSIFLFPQDVTILGEEGLSLDRSHQYRIFFVRKMWLLCLISFWVYIFLGGLGNWVSIVTFPLKVMASLFAFTLLRSGYPLLRSSDSAELTVRWLLPLCFVGILVEAIWVGIFG